MQVIRDCARCNCRFGAHFVPWFDKMEDIATLCDDCERIAKMNVVTKCPLCGNPVSMSEMDVADGYERYCEDCETGLPGMYELIQAERRSMDADPDWQERQGPYISEFSVAGDDEILISDIDGDELWKFTANQVDTLLLELEVLLVYMRDGVKLDKRDIEKAFDEIKSMRRRFVSAA